MTRKVYAIAPDGSIVTSQTHRPYTWAVLVRDKASTEQRWLRASMHSTRPLAERAFAKWEERSGARVRAGEVVLVPVTDVKPSDPPATVTNPSEEATTTADPIQQKIDRDIARMREQQDKFDALIDTLQARYDDAQAEEDELWGDPKSEPAGKKLERWDAASKAAAEAGNKLRQALAAREQNERRIDQLLTKEEYDRRAAVAQRITRMKEEGNMATKKTTARDQGVPEVYLSESGNFKPGLDARYKSDLIASILGEMSDKALETFDPADAQRRLDQRNWGGFLAKTQAAREAAAARKAKAKATSEQKARAATKPKAAAKPDPKPSRRRKAA